MLKSLRGRAAGTAAVALAAALAVAEGARVMLALDAWYPLYAAACFAVIGATAVSRIDASNHPFDTVGAANQVTMARAVFVALLAALVGQRGDPMIAGAAAAAAATVTLMDGVDGWLARRSRVSSVFGARFDMEVDALLILVLSVLAWRYEKAGAWVLMSGLFRYLFVIAGWLWRWMERPLEPSRRRQTVCVVQVVALIAAVEPFVPPPSSGIVAAAALIALAGSFAVDTRWLVLHRREQMS